MEPASLQKTASHQKAVYLLGLCCANCAAKIEGRTRKIDGVTAANVDFVAQKLTVEVAGEKTMPAVLREVSQIVKDVEPDIKISYTPKAETDEDEGDARQKWIKRIAFILGVVLYGVAFLPVLPHLAKVILFLVSYVLIGGEVVWQSIKNITKGQVFDEHFLMTVATIGAMAIGEYPEGVAVMLFYQVGEAFQDMAVNRSRRSIASLMDIRPDFANLKVGNDLKKVSPEEVGIGEVIVVKPGEKVPLDGKIISGVSSLDTSALTGESVPRDVEVGDVILSGSINKTGALTIEVTKEFGESTVSKILDLVQNASSKKAKTENFITKFAHYYTPIVTFSAVALAIFPPLLIPGATFTDWIYRALAFLVVSCPCALVISVPLSFFGGIGGASRQGILVKGSNYLEALDGVDTIVMDKTGTLTRGSFHVARTEEANSFSKEDLLYYAAYAEYYSNHPIALSVKNAYGKSIDPSKISENTEKAGFGICAQVGGKKVLAGNDKLMNSSNISYQKMQHVVGSVVYIAVEGVFAGAIEVADEIKPDAKLAVKDMHTCGIKQTIMLTGDTKEAGEAVAKELGITKVYTELLPPQKVEKFEEVMENEPSDGKIAFVGDGVNDAPVLARADVGIAMGALGSDAAIEAADVVLMTDEPSKIVTAISIAHRTKKIVWQNIWFALAVKVLVLVLATVGIATMWEAVFGDVGVTIIAILNSMRAMKVGRR